MINSTSNTLLAQAAADSSARGFSGGVSIIWNYVKPAESGLAVNHDISVYIVVIIQFLLGLVAVLALAAIVWGSIMYILSLGDEGRAGTAKKIILYAIVGVLLSGASFMILQVLRNLFVGS